MIGRKVLFIILLYCAGIIVVPLTAESKESQEFMLPVLLPEVIIPLEGEWEFYWGELYTPTDFEQNRVKQVPYTVKVPSPWTEYATELGSLPSTGYATYRLVLQFQDQEVGSIKSLYIPRIASAYTMWIEGKQKVNNGVVGLHREAMTPDSTPKITSFVVTSPSIELLIQASNFHQRNAGMTEPILIGEPDTILQYDKNRLIYRGIIVASLIAIGFYHFALFAFRRDEYSLITFAFICLFVALRALVIEAGLASYILPFLSWEVAVKIEYLGVSLGVLFITLFTYFQFPEDMNKKIRNLLISILSIYSLFVLMTPAIIYTKTMVLLQILIIPAFATFLHVYIKAVLQAREGSLLNTLATLVLFLTTINDILFYNQLIKSIELASVGLLFFLFTQAIIISKKYSISFQKKERLTKELSLLNASLEQQVHERTEELRTTNQALQLSNTKLTEAHQFRSDWIHNLSHEISTPLTSILAYSKGMLDGVVDHNKKNMGIIYHQSLYLSKMLQDLHVMVNIENRQLQFRKEKVDIANYLLELYEKYKWEIEKDGIEFLFINHCEDNTPLFVSIDTMRMEQVVVNLLKNAKKFVKEKGKIKLRLQRDENTIIISVEDNGIGIDEQDIEKVFHRFYKGNNQGIEKGSGLGLAISKEIVERHYGEIGVESTKGEGSTFTIQLSLANKA